MTRIESLIYKIADQPLPYETTLLSWPSLPSSVEEIKSRFRRLSLGSLSRSFARNDEKSAAQGG